MLGTSPRNLTISARLLATVGLGAILVAGSASAEIEEIVITAKKREQSLQQTSISVSAFSANEVEKSRLYAVADFAEQTLGVTFSQAAGANTFLSIRGSFKSTDSPGIDQTAAIFIDEVYNAGMVDFDPEVFDVERVEILRGPQGTLFGRNSLGGAISIITKRPEFTVDAGAQITFGDDDRREVRGYATGPLSDNVAARVAFMSNAFDGYVTNVATGNDVGARDKTAVRGQILYDNKDNFTALISADYLWEESDPVVYTQWLNFTPSLFPAGTGVTGDPDSVAFEEEGFIDRELRGGLLRMDWAMDAGTLTSVSGYRETKYRSLQEAEGSPIPTANTGVSNNNSQFSQELRFASPSGQGNFEWLAGLYFMDQKRKRQEDIAFDILPGQVLGLFGLPEGLTISNQSQKIKTKSYAVFGSATYRFDEKFSVDVGGRFTVDDKKGTTRKFGSPNPITHSEVYAVDYSDDWSAWTGQASLNYQATDDVFAFATISRGFTSGGFPIFGLTAADAVVPLDPEYSWNYEAGVKSRWLDDRLQINGSIFMIKYKNLQVETLTDMLVFQLDNAAKSEVKGVDLEVLAQPIEGLTLSAGYGYMDSEYTDFENCTDDGLSCTGNEITQTPKHTLNLSADLTVPVSDAFNLSLRGEYTYKSKVLLTPTGERPDFIRDQTAYDGIVDARVALQTTDGQWELALWGKNLTDERTIVSSVQLASLVGTFPELLGGLQYYRSVYTRPRSFGVSLTWNLP